MTTQITFFYDYLCPFANRLTVLLKALSYPLDLEISWKAFSLEQSNYHKQNGFKFWEHPETPSRSVRALAASKAALNQGEQAFMKLHHALFTARHTHGQNIGKAEVIFELAKKCGVDALRLKKDLARKDCWAAVGKDHEEATEMYNIFGVPTLLFSKGGPAYIKLAAIPESEEEKISLFNLIKEMAQNRPYLLELKRPDLKIL